MSQLHIPGGVPSPTALVKAMEALEAHVTDSADSYASRYPEITGVTHAQAHKMARALSQAVTEAIPAKVHVRVRLFNEVDVHVIDANNAEVWCGDDYVTIPLAQLTAYWVQTGHRIP